LWTFEQHSRTSEGEEGWYQWKARSIFGEQDQLIEIQLVGRDITELKRAEESTRLQAARANALASTAARLNSRLDLNKVLDTVCEEAARAMNAPAVAVFLNDSDRAVLYPAALEGLPHKSTSDLTRIPLKEYSRYSQKLGSIVAIKDLQAEPRFPNAPLLIELGVRAIASASMLRDGRLLGVLMPMRLDVREYSDDELTLLKALADQAALAISNARLFEDTERSLEYVQSLREIDLAIAGASMWHPSQSRIGSGQETA
jgi:GAF domain-containing protein